jgi:two-component system response regulator
LTEGIPGRDARVSQIGWSADPPVVLVAEGDDVEFNKTSFAMTRAHIQNPVRRVRSGEQLVSYLRRKNEFVDVRSSPTPAMILLDLGLPDGSAREALRVIRTDPALRWIPMVVLTGSAVDGDMPHAYELGVKSFILKPLSFQSLVHSFTALGRCWLEIVETAPPRPAASQRIAH